EAPILLAWRLQQAGLLGRFDPWTLVARAARYLILHSPVTGQERWEENSGYSPSTLASVIAALVCAAEICSRRRKEALTPVSERDQSLPRDEALGAGLTSAATEQATSFILDYADWLSAYLEEWTVTDRGELVPGKPRHYIRINPADPNQPNVVCDPDTALIQLANGGGRHSARNIVSTDFLEMVRLGVRDPHDPLILDSLAVIDQVLKRDLPQGPCWRRYNH